MTQIPKSYCDRLSAWAFNNENLGWMLKIAGVAIFALGMGMATTGFSTPISPSNASISNACIDIRMSGLLGGLLLGFAGIAIGIGCHDRETFSFQKNIKYYLVITGLAVALFGIGMASGALALQHSLSAPDNIHYFSQATLDEVSAHSTTLTALGFTLIPMIGGSIGAAGLLSSIPQRITQWFKDRADAKSKVEAAKDTENPQLDGGPE